MAEFTQYDRTLAENRLEDIKEELQMAYKTRREYKGSAKGIVTRLAEESIKELKAEQKAIKKTLKEAFENV